MLEKIQDIVSAIIRIKSVNYQRDQKNWEKVLKGEMDELELELEEGKEEEKRKNKKRYRRKGEKERKSVRQHIMKWEKICRDFKMERE